MWRGDLSQTREHWLRRRQWVSNEQIYYVYTQATCYWMYHLSVVDLTGSNMFLELPAYPREKWSLTSLQPCPRMVSLSDQAEWSQPWISWSLRRTPRDQCQALWNTSPSPASWASARKLAASEKDASATSVVQSSFRFDRWKDLPVAMNKHVVESCEFFPYQPFEDYAELVHTVQVII